MSERVYYAYTELEEFHAGMWRIVRGSTRLGLIEAAAALLRDPERFAEAIREVLARWPKSCEMAFTAEATNRIAWLGQAACCIAVNAPEEATRAAWSTLMPSHQDDANRAAGEALTEWMYQRTASAEVSLFTWNAND